MNDRADGERLAVLESRLDATDKSLREFSAESREDRKRLHESLDKLTQVLQTWQSRQTGFIAGASFILTMIAVGLSAGWRELVDFFKGHP